MEWPKIGVSSTLQQVSMVQDSPEARNTKPTRKLTKLEDEKCRNACERRAFRPQTDDPRETAILDARDRTSSPPPTSTISATPLHCTHTMPPIPPKFDQETTDLVESIQRRRKDIDTFQLPRLEKCTGPLSTQQQYASELRDDIDILAKQIDVSARLYSAQVHLLRFRQ